MRIGQGYDSHKFCKHRVLFLGGVRVPHGAGLAGHSDADVLTHAIIDALLGAAKLGDIGRLFPDNDSQYQNVSSILLLERVYSQLQLVGYKIANVDATIITEAPKLAPFIPQMEANIAAACAIGVGQVSIKAKTAEGMGFVGRGEGIEVHAICLIEKVII